MFSAYLKTSSDALLESFNSRAGPLKTAGLMLRLLLTDTATGSKPPIITLTWSPAEHPCTNLEVNFYFPHWKKERVSMAQASDAQRNPKHTCVCHIPELPCTDRNWSNPHIWKPEHIHRGSKAGTGTWAQTVKTLTFPTWVFTLPVVFAVTPSPLGGNHPKCHWPNVCFLICIACTDFTLLPFKRCQIFENCSVPKL